MTFLIQQTMLFAVPLMIVALAGVFSERSGIINLALEGIMIFGAFIGVRQSASSSRARPFWPPRPQRTGQPCRAMSCSRCLPPPSWARCSRCCCPSRPSTSGADQTIGGTALNLLAPGSRSVLRALHANQNTLQMQEGDAASWFMIKKTTLGFEKNADLGFLGNTLLHKVYLATYICIILFVILSIILYKTKFGLRLRACGRESSGGRLSRHQRL